jgi:hypothetical protein
VANIRRERVMQWDAAEGKGCDRGLGQEGFRGARPGAEINRATEGEWQCERRRAPELG